MVNNEALETAGCHSGEHRKYYHSTKLNLYQNNQAVKKSVTPKKVR